MTRNEVKGNISSVPRRGKRSNIVIFRIVTGLKDIGGGEAGVRVRYRVRCNIVVVRVRVTLINRTKFG